MIDRTYGHLARDPEESSRAPSTRGPGEVALMWRRAKATTDGDERKTDDFARRSRVERTGIEPVTSGLQS